ncbi:MAG: ATP-binding protein [Elusimicrobiota bacterium]
MKITDYEKKLLRKIGRTINRYEMISANDTVAVAISGGKDSYALLEALHLRRRYLPIKYNLTAVHIDFGFSGDNTLNIQEFCKERGIEIYIEKRNIEKNNKSETSCFWCSWNRRKALFEFIRRLKINKLAFAHHMDDVIETMFLNMMYQSRFESFLPNTIFFSGELNVIRPLFECSDAEMKEYALYKGFPKDLMKCPFGIKSRRAEIREMIKKLSEKHDDESFKYSMLNSWVTHISDFTHHAIRTTRNE